MKLEALVRASLWLTAPFNLIAGFAFAIPSSAVSQLIQLPADTHPFYAVFSGAMVALFGCGYFWLAMQERINQPLLFVGATGKLLAVLIVWGLWLTDQLATMPTVLISGDLIFALLWFYYLITVQQTEEVSHS